MDKTMEHAIEVAVSLATNWGLKVLGAVLILVAGWIAAAWVSRKVRTKIETSKKLDDTLAGFASGGVRIFILLITFVAVLNNFGIQTASIIAVLGAAGLAVGLALQGTLSNVASGIVLLILRPFRRNDAVEVGGKVGTVQEIGLFAIQLRTFDGLFVMIPNSQVWGNTIVNLARNGTRRVELVIGISYDDDMDKAIQLIQGVLAEESRILPEPAPLVAVSALNESSVDLIVRPWTTFADWWPTTLDLTKLIKERCDEEGISIPFPQRDVHLIQENQETPEGENR